MMFKPGAKVVFVGGTCPFCECVRQNYPNSWDDVTELMKGRAYTVRETDHIDLPEGFTGCGIRVWEYEHPKRWYHCSCQFREIDGDEDAWNQMMHQHRPKTKELIPA
jgi:hypothetical protein